MDLNKLYKQLSDFNQKRGYFLNPNKEFTRGLLKGLLANEKRYGYQSCPCRLATGNKEDDLDIICPCDYRDPDIVEFGNCFCGLYVSKKAIENKIPTVPIPERRANKDERIKMKEKKDNSPKKSFKSSFPVWRCQVCGFLCAREQPPEVCPICGAEKERFEKFA